jgi:hypothetical protein
MELKQDEVNIWTLVHYYLENECDIEKLVVWTYPSMTLFDVINVIKKDTK